MLVAEPLRFFRGVIKNALALLAERNFHRSGNALANRDSRFDFLANGFDRAVGAQKAIGQRLIFPQEPQ